jgi:cyanate permease
MQKERLKEPNGIGGWLLLIWVIPCIVSIALNLMAFFTLIFLDNSSISSYNLTNLSIITGIIGIVWGITSLIFMSLKKKFVPKLIILFLIFKLIEGFTLLVEDYFEIIPIILNVCAIIYFLKSKRVKNTFVK